MTEEDLQSISHFIVNLYDTVEIPPLSSLMKLMSQDKKNRGSEISFSLLSTIGKCEYDVSIDSNWIEDAIHYYQSIK